MKNKCQYRIGQLQIFLILAFGYICLTPICLLAQSNDVVFDPTTAPLPTDLEGYFKWGISFVVPAIIQGLRWLVDKFGQRVPKWVWPVSTGMIGFALGHILSAVGALNLTWWDSAQAGAAAVSIREFWVKFAQERETPTEAVDRVIEQMTPEEKTVAASKLR